jgi:diguanylate cyclase (GGDEF)-like protein
MRWDIFPMPEDISALFAVSVQVEAMLGLLLLYTWVQNAEIKAIGWWGCGYLLRAGSIALFGMLGRLPDTITIDVANAILLTSFAVTWTGARLFCGRRINPFFLFEGTLIWLVACQIPHFADSIPARTLLSSGIIAAYTWFTAAELWRGNAGNEVSRLPAIFMLFAQGVLFLMHTPLAVVTPHIVGTQPAFRSVWLTVMSSEALLFTIAIAFLLMATAKERAGYLNSITSLLDPLSGIWNRHGFIAEDNRLMEAMAHEAEGAAVLSIDLDDFAAINEGCGPMLRHRTLEILAAIIRASINPSDLVGRLRGDVLAVILFAVSRDCAVAAAERIRSAFADQAGTVAGQRVCATVSIGVIPREGPVVSFTEQLWMANYARVRAKERGGNQVDVLEKEYFYHRKETQAPIGAILRA